MFRTAMRQFEQMFPKKMIQIRSAGRKSLKSSGQRRSAGTGDFPFRTLQSSAVNSKAASSQQNQRFNIAASSKESGQLLESQSDVFIAERRPVLDVIPCPPDCDLTVGAQGRSYGQTLRADASRRINDV